MLLTWVCITYHACQHITSNALSRLDEGNTQVSFCLHRVNYIGPAKLDCTSLLSFLDAFCVGYLGNNLEP